MDKLFYTIGETAQILGESVSLVRYWSNAFPKYIKPHRNAKGNRLYRAEDVEVLKKIHLMVNGQGLTLEGVAKQLSQKDSAADKKFRVLESLRNIREQLLEVRNSL